MRLLTAHPQPCVASGAARCQARLSAPGGLLAPLRPAAPRRGAARAAIAEDALAAEPLPEEEAKKAAEAVPPAEEAGNAEGPSASGGAEKGNVPPLAAAKGGKGKKKRRGRPGSQEWSTDKVLDDHGLVKGDCEPGTVVWSNLNGARIALDRDPRILAYMPVKLGPMGVRSTSEENLYTQRKFGKDEHSGKRQGCLPVGLRREFEILQVPDEVYEGGKGPLVGAKNLDTELTWHRAKQIKDICQHDKEVYTVQITDVNNGGLLTSVEGIPAFVPISHIPKRKEGDWFTGEELKEFVGSDVDVSVFNINQNKGTIVCSILEAEHNKTLRQLQPGALVWGTVRKAMDFGVFIGIDGTAESALLHVSNMSGIRTEKVSELFAVGDRVRAVLVGMDADFTRLSLSTAELEEEPGDMHNRREWVYENADTTVQRFLEYLEEAEGEAEGEDEYFE